MRLFPIIFSMNYVTYEIVPEVTEALEKAGFYVYEAACVQLDGSYIGFEKFLVEIRNYIAAAWHMCKNSPSTEVALVIHYDNPSIFSDKRLQKLVGNDEPFINYVDAATNETSVCIFEDGEMKVLYQSDNMPPFKMLGHGFLCMNEDYELHVVPVQYNHVYINDAILSVRERWLESVSSDGKSAVYLRTYRDSYDGSTVRRLYEALYANDIWKCMSVPDEHQNRHFIEDISENVLNAGSVLRTYDCYEIIGTDIFLLIADGRYSDLLVSLSSTKEQMNKFLDSQLCKMLVEVKK
ncbi:hypothetical protein IK110_04010 [Candidatus Saccharibacteria bacterium]|nr:hypothetical protein [Candidatus Saccharibacteria bacterium]